MTTSKKALILIDHGSKVKEANDLLSEIALKLETRSNTGFDLIETCHMELASPTLNDAFNKCIKNGIDDITVHPYFLVPGRHSKTDIPNMVNELKDKYPHITCKITEPLGIHDKILDVILERSFSVKE